MIDRIIILFGDKDPCIGGDYNSLTNSRFIRIDLRCLPNTLRYIVLDSFNYI
jgi:hypothetical protein